MASTLRSREVSRPPGPDMSVLEIVRVIRSGRTTDFLKRVAAAAPTVGHFRLAREHAYLVSTPELIRELFIDHGRVAGR